MNDNKFNTIDWVYLEGLFISSIIKGIPYIKVGLSKHPNDYAYKPYIAIRDTHEVCVHCYRYYEKDLIKGHLCTMCSNIISGDEKNKIKEIIAGMVNNEVY